MYPRSPGLLTPLDTGIENVSDNAGLRYAFSIRDCLDPGAHIRGGYHLQWLCVAPPNRHAFPP